MDRLRPFVRGIIPVMSFAQETPDKPPVFVPEAGGRWGAPANLQFAVDPTDTEELEEEETQSAAVFEPDEKITRHGTEVDQSVTDPETGEEAVKPYDYVCFCGSIIRKFVESKQSGSVTVKKRVTEQIDVYVDAKPLVMPFGSFMAKEVQNTIEEP